MTENQKKYFDRLKKINEQKRIKRFEEIDFKFGNSVRDKINNGGCVKDICELISKGPLPTTAYLKYYNLFKNALSNGKLIQKQKAREQWIKNGKKQTIKMQERIDALPKITQKAEKIYQKGIKDDLFRREIISELQKINQSHNYNKLRLIYGQPKRGHGGKRNSMYGKSPSPKSGYGIYGHILIDGKKTLFRSSLELSIYLYFLENRINFLLSKHRIKYKFKNKDRTYCPDIVINNKIFEIKPKKLISIPINILKFAALKKYCKNFNLQCDYITEETYNIKNMLEKDKILKLIEEEKLFLTEKQKARLIQQFQKSILNSVID